MTMHYTTHEVDDGVCCGRREFHGMEPHLIAEGLSDNEWVEECIRGWDRVLRERQKLGDRHL